MKNSYDIFVPPMTDKSYNLLFTASDTPLTPQHKHCPDVVPINAREKIMTRCHDWLKRPRRAPLAVEGKNIQTVSVTGLNSHSSASLKLEDPDKPPDQACHVCGSTSWWWRKDWQRVGGSWLCGRCHPGPATVGQVNGSPPADIKTPCPAVTREKLSKDGKPVLTGTNVPVSWASYCEFIGLEKRTAARRMGEISPPHQGKQTSPNYGEVTQQRLSEYRKLARIAGVTLGAVSVVPLWYH